MTRFASVKMVPCAPEIYACEWKSRYYFLEAHSLRWLARSASELNAPMDFGKILTPVFPARTDPGSCRTLILNVTHSCNLRCCYCFVRQHGEALQSMSESMALQAIALLFPAGAHPLIGFFGGEPLLQWDLITAVTAFCENAYDGAKFMLTTNGTLLNAQRAQFLAEHKFGMLLSLDGSASRHDRLRPFANGAGSYLAALDGVKHLAHAGVKPVLRSTFGSGGIDLVAELESLNRLCDEGLASDVAIEPVSLAEGCNAQTEAISAGFITSMKAQYMAAADWFIARARDGKRAHFRHLTKTLETLLLGVPMCTECGAGNGYLTLSPASEIHACHREQSRVGLLDHATIIWEGARRAWLDNRLECHAECPSCALRYLCGGGCRYDAMLGSGDVRRPNARNCELQKVRLLMALRVLDELGEPLAAKAAGIDLSRRAQLRPVVKCNKSPTEA